MDFCVHEITHLNLSNTNRVLTADVGRSFYRQVASSDACACTLCFQRHSLRPSANSSELVRRRTGARQHPTCQEHWSANRLVRRRVWQRFVTEARRLARRNCKNNLHVLIGNDIVHKLTFTRSAVLPWYVVCLSVRPSVCNVGGLWSHALELSKNNFTADYSRDLGLGRHQHHGSTPKGTPLNFSPNRSGVGKKWHAGEQKRQYLWNV